MNEIALVLAIGLVGGFVHEILGGQFTVPSLEKKADSPLALKFGSLGEIVLGAGAAFVTYVSMTVTEVTGTVTNITSTVPNAPGTTSIEFIRLCFLAFTSGIGGSAILKAYMNGEAANKNRMKVEAAEAYVVAHTKEKKAIDSDTMKEFMKILNGI